MALDREDLDFRPEGLVVMVKRSKTDQEGQGRTVGIPFGRSPESCPVHVLQAWLDAAGIVEGAVFRGVNRHGQVRPGRLSDRAVALVVKRCARAAGIDDARFAGHSLRSGLATAAARNGASERAIMKQTGHRSTAMVRRYIHDGELFLDNAAGVSGL